MSIKIGLISKNTELLEDFRLNMPDSEVVSFRNIDNISREKCGMFIIDYDEIGDPESTQFYLSRLRKKILDIPVVIILRVNTVSDLQSAWFFNDFILYPFRKGEVYARLKRIMAENVVDDEEISIGNLSVNIKEYTVFLENEKIDLTYKEFELLRLFLQNRGTVFSRKEVLNRIWGMEYIGGTRTVDVHIRRLRSKLGEDFNTIIETVRNVGYKCVE